MDIPEILWKAYIDFEVELEDWERVRELYERLLDKTKHVKVWLSYAKFETSIEEFENAREVYLFLSIYTCVLKYVFIY